MKALSVICKTLGYIWLILAGLLVLAGIIVIWMNEGFSGVQDTISPFNAANWLTTVITFAPGAVLLALSKRFQPQRLINA